MRFVLGERPPCYAAARSAFGPSVATAYFTWGDAIYSPSGHTPSGEIVAHEAVHMQQQLEVGGPEAWWERYFRDPAWRLEQEIAGYRAQYRYWSDRSGRKERRYALMAVARLISGPLYGNLISFEEAKSRILAE